MKNLFKILILSLFVTFSFCNVQDFKYENQLITRGNLFYDIQTYTPYTGIVVTMFSEGVLNYVKREFHVVDGIRHGYYIEFSGHFYKFYSRQISEEGEFVNGKKHGEWFKYQNSKIHVTVYDNGTFIKKYEN